MKANQCWGRLLIFAGIFLCFSLMYFFIVPQIDVLLFARESGSTLAEITRSAYEYGNGRFLGNLFGMTFSNAFVFSFLVIAFFMTGIVCLINQIVFSGNIHTILPIAFLIAFPSSHMMGECYYLYAAFANYVLPAFFILLCECIVKQLRKKKYCSVIRIALYVLLFVLAAASALFSENTTIVLLALTFLHVLRSFQQDSGKVCSIVYLLGALAGAFCMMYIPVVSQSAYKMDGYRKLETNGLFNMLENAASVFVKFSEIVSSFTVLTIVLSLAFLLVLRGKDKKAIYTIAKAVFVCYPLYAVIISFVNDTFLYFPMVQVFQGLAALLYLAAIIVGVSAMPDRESRVQSCRYLILLAVSVGPLLLASQYGNRTFFLTYVLLIVWALELLEQQKKTLALAIKKFRIKARTATAAMICLFAFVSCIIFVQSVLNYDFYTVRTAYIAQEITKGETEITIPVLPCRSITFEDDWSNTISLLLSDENAAKIKLQLAYSAAQCENYTDYEQFFSGSPLHPFTYALSHLEYKNPYSVHPEL